MASNTSKRIMYGSRPPKSFVEEFEFTQDSPYFIRVKQLEAEDFAPPHYSKYTIEILLCDSVSGKISIDQKVFQLHSEERAAFVIPPDIIHSTSFSSGGTVQVMQISIPYMNGMINFPAMLEKVNIKVSELVNSFPEYDRLYPYFQQLIENDGNCFACCRTLISIMEELCCSLREKEHIHGALAEHSNAELKKLIGWSGENYSMQISIDMAAKLVGMSRSYFCSWFKSKTNMTYVQYLNQVRISNAARLLISGESTSATAYECGFTNASYFIQVFKKTHGCTPKEYVLRYSHS